ncbi:MAG: isomerizing glutamine--fructose-6-phosphate transaminase, partial [Gemmatimonadota bacterium]
MCGIVGYVGSKQAAPLLLEGLRRLEYRGYDSAGLSVLQDGRIATRKVAGKILGLAEVLETDCPPGTVGIAHTRWATHGAPTKQNAHPHTDCTGRFALAHNGIIENAGFLRKKLEALGHTFHTETDTEVLVHLIEEAFSGSLEEAVADALAEVEGTYGIAVISSADPGKVVAARLGSPLLLGLGAEGEYWVASDASAVLAHTRDVVYLDDGELAVLTRDGYLTLDLETRPVSKEVSQIAWDLETIEKGGYPHFMLKEIMEQPESLRNTMRGRLLDDEGVSRLGGLEQTLSEEDLAEVERIVITACGTSWHSGLIGEYMIEEFARIPV